VSLEILFYLAIEIQQQSEIYLFSMEMEFYPSWVC